jgi:hypothetical protein
MPGCATSTRPGRGAVRRRQSGKVRGQLAGLHLTKLVHGISRPVPAAHVRFRSLAHSVAPSDGGYDSFDWGTGWYPGGAEQLRDAVGYGYQQRVDSGHGVARTTSIGCSLHALPSRLGVHHCCANTEPDLANLPPLSSLAARPQARARPDVGKLLCVLLASVTQAAGLESGRREDDRSRGSGLEHRCLEQSCFASTSHQSTITCPQVPFTVWRCSSIPAAAYGGPCSSQGIMCLMETAGRSTARRCHGSWSTYFSVINAACYWWQLHSC